MSTKIEIDRGLCNGCKRCVDSCFVDVIRWNDKEEHPVVAYPDDCVWCFSCEIACLVQCIEVVSDIPGRLVEPY